MPRDYVFFGSFAASTRLIYFPAKVPGRILHKMLDRALKMKNMLLFWQNLRSFGLFFLRFQTRVCPLDDFSKAKSFSLRVHHCDGLGTAFD